MSMHFNIHRRLAVFTSLVLLTSVLAISACNDTFEPLKENDRYFFSIYGYLDASADTQWVRIIPLREAINQLPDLNAKVTLQNVETGESVVMKDSLFEYFGGNMAWNFWTTMELNPEGIYKLSAINENGNESSVKVEMPPDFPTPIVFEDTSAEFGIDTIMVQGVENLADVRTIWQIQEISTSATRIYNFPHLQDTVETEIGSHKIVMEPFEDIESISRFYHPDLNEALEQFTVRNSQVWIASAGPGWLFFPDIDEGIVTLPDGISNVENGTGYVIGIVSKAIPLKSCYADNEEDEAIACDEETPLWSVPIH